MPFDYGSLRAKNVDRYGWDFGRIGQMLLAERYDDRTHFIFELLQNAEDALARRPVWDGSRAVAFNLSDNELRIAHFGQPFNPEDVLGICGIAESTKDLTAIGRFGIGFKSVYAFTNGPEVHSGEEDFAIDNYVLPAAVPKIGRQPDETVFVLPLREDDESALEEIVRGLQHLGPRALLFLRQIEEIGWSLEGGRSSLYLRGKPMRLGENVRRISLIGEKEGKLDVEETWLVFSREARTKEDEHVGYVEIAFSVSQDNNSGRWSVQRIEDSFLVVFFPTIVQTNLGFLVQGPYRTTPSRDNVPRNDSWNRHLVSETAALLVEALRWLRDDDRLDTTVLQCLPLDRAKFDERNLFASLFEAVRKAMAAESLLPKFGGEYVAASKAKLARTQELRELFSPSQLGTLVGADGAVFWLSSDITQDRTPQLRHYLMRELQVGEITPETMLPMLSKAFLEAQTDEWIWKLYEFFNGQPALLRQGRLAEVPLIRMEDGHHVAVKENLELTNLNLPPVIFLPSAIETGFQTVRRAVCATDETRKFLQALGLTEADPVDAVMWYVLLKYQGKEVAVTDEEYEADIGRILTAFRTDSKAKRDKLLSSLRIARFVKVRDAGSGEKSWSMPGEVYIRTERLTKLFEGISGVLFVDDSYACHRSEEARQLLEACDATSYLKPIRNVELTLEKLWEVREKAGTVYSQSKHKEKFEDHSLRGLESLLTSLAKINSEGAKSRAKLLWEALSDLEQHQRSVFTGRYEGYYYVKKTLEFPPSFVKLLNNSAWVPGQEGKLEHPESVVFAKLGWTENPFLLSKIHFKPPVIETLAKEAGIEPGVLELLKKHGLTNVRDLLSRLGLEDKPKPPKAPVPQPANGARKDLSRKTADSVPSAPSSSGTGPNAPDDASDGNGDREGTGVSSSTGSGTRTGAESTTGARSPGAQGDRGKGPQDSTGGRSFISYIAVSPDEAEPDPDGLDQEARMDLEKKAIQHVLLKEPFLQTTSPNNVGYDLYEVGEDSQQIRWVEVKAMTGWLQDRPVGLSRAQFECAHAHGDAYWLYIVEHAADAQAVRIVRMKDPAGKARTFTFDQGWLNVAEVAGKPDLDAEDESRQE